MLKKIGITTTVPSEVLFAAGYQPIDLNNAFISNQFYDKYIELAEQDGFPKSSCAWIKGIYGACIKNGVDEILGVAEGDCSNTRALLDVLKGMGIKVKTMSYPHRHTIGEVTSAIDALMEMFEVELNQVEAVRSRLNDVRVWASIVDELTYIHNKATGFENHILQVSLSDFDGDVDNYLDMLKKKIIEIEKRESQGHKTRLGYIGVPPMLGDIYEYVEKHDARFVYNEVQREFAFPRASHAKNIYEQYFDYTYPFDINFRLKEIKRQIKLRKLNGIVHYTQAFCHRAIEDIVIKKELDIPVLTIEGDKINHLDSRTKLRIEAFIDMLHDFKEPLR